AGLRAHGLAPRAMQLARRALTRGAPADARTYRLLYPFGYEDLVRAEAKARQVDPALVAALIRQESNFEPRAVSRVGAAGLMQIMPEVGRKLATAHGFTTWKDPLLRQPEVNVQLGTAHLATLLRQYRDVGHALAAYNAGSGRVARWLTKRGTEDPEVFVERIPFTETRDYVRIVQRNRAIYGALYGASPNAADGR
ncbi:MAG: lytic transglycosylase domain-containing protein, partial [Gemmatimonadota bacterium]|nr:lytic transglycosylase domain-containing protein [Gemmatimonadota bacterium]